jgi:hypothetical protein
VFYSLLDLVAGRAGYTTEAHVEPTYRLLGATDAR